MISLLAWFGWHACGCAACCTPPATTAGAPRQRPAACGPQHVRPRRPRERSHLLASLFALACASWSPLALFVASCRRGGGGRTEGARRIGNYEYVICASSPLGRGWKLECHYANHQPSLVTAAGKSRQCSEPLAKRARVAPCRKRMPSGGPSARSHQSVRCASSISMTRGCAARAPSHELWREDPREDTREDPRHRRRRRGAPTRKTRARA